MWFPFLIHRGIPMCDFTHILFWSEKINCFHFIVILSFKVCRGYHICDYHPYFVIKCKRQPISGTELDVMMHFYFTFLLSREISQGVCFTWLQCQTVCDGQSNWTQFQYCCAIGCSVYEELVSKTSYIHIYMLLICSSGHSKVANLVYMRKFE